MYIYVFVNLFGLLFELVSLTFFSRCPRLSHLLCHFTYCCFCCCCCLSYLFAYGKVKLRRNSSRVVISGLPPSSLWANLKSIQLFYDVHVVAFYFITQPTYKHTRTHTHTPFFRNVSSLSLCRLFVFCEYILCILPINNIYSEFQFQAF